MICKLSENQNHLLGLLNTLMPWAQPTEILIQEFCHRAWNLFFFLSTLLRYNLQTIRWTHFKHKVQSVLMKAYIPVTTKIYISITQKRFLMPFALNAPTPPNSWPQPSIDVLSL